MNRHERVASIAPVDPVVVFTDQQGVVSSGEARTEEIDDILVEVLPGKRARVHRHARQASLEECRWDRQLFWARVRLITDEVRSCVL